MNHSLSILCEALKQIFSQLKPQSHALSFLLLTGRVNQGKSTLMRHSPFDHYPIDAEGAHIYYNPQGVIVELGETWFDQTPDLLENTIKQLNKVNRYIKINGILLCLDINELLIADHSALKSIVKANTKLLERLGQVVQAPLDLAIVLTKLDLLAGFCEFYEAGHPSELSKPLGFSIFDAQKPHKFLDIFTTKFEQFVEQLGQQVTNKIHPIRSNVKRTLIRELPLQIASLRNLILPLISSISSKLFHLQALYFTSGEQGGIISDRLNKKIQHEFALVVQEKFFQSNHYRPYFIEGALFAFQKTTQRVTPRLHPQHLRIKYSLTVMTVLGVSWIGYHYFSVAHVLSGVKRELQVVHQMKNADQNDAAIYHLAKASLRLEALSSDFLRLPKVKDLNLQLKDHTQKQLLHYFIPHILQELEQVLREANQTQVQRYTALKIYLMLAERKHYRQEEVVHWFTQHWQTNPKEINKKLSLLTQILNDPGMPIALNPQIITDARNYLNALPSSYLYYALAKNQLDDHQQPIDFKGFKLSNPAIPNYLTAQGFQVVISKLPNISKELSAENWILERQDLKDLNTILQQAYCDDYVMWWQHFSHNTHPIHTQDYADVHHLMQTLVSAQSIPKLVQMIQVHTRPKTKGPYANIFNRDIASKFSDLNLLSVSNLNQLTTTLSELGKFSNTLSLVSDRGKTAFFLTKARFQGDKLANPVSELYNQAQHLPEPLAQWTQQIAEDIGFNLINDTRQYINFCWQDKVYKNYQKNIATHYPIAPTGSQEISLDDFNRFFSPHGELNPFIEEYIKPFLDTSKPQWERKEIARSVIPISDETINELIRANVITHMFFPNHEDKTKIEFSLQKINLDPMVSQLQLTLGKNDLIDNQGNDSYTAFHWPQSNAELILRSIEGKEYKLTETGVWAFFKLLQKVNVLMDEQDPTNLQILFEINGNSGRYLLKTQNQVNPFIPGILAGLNLQESIV